MKQQFIPPGDGVDYDWANDHVYVKGPFEASDGRVTLVEDTLKPGFLLARHHHRSMVEMFYILDGSVTFTFDDETIEATAGATVIIPPGVWHTVACIEGGRLLTVFTPGGFDHYLSELAAMAPEQLDDADAVQLLGETYDLWTREPTSPA
jgi:quercetin dioxygenase-like cupin family protein